MAVPFAEILRCQTDSGTVAFSGAVKDDLLIPGQFGKLCFKLLEGYGALQLNLPAYPFVAVGAYQESLSGCHPLVGFLRG
jgi:hypothetical protein